MNSDSIIDLNKSKQTIFLIGDSTVQSYGIGSEPQAGWGQLLMRHFALDKSYIKYHPESTRFGQVVRYESDDLIIDNRAMAGRSARNYYDEQRAEDAIKEVQKGDIVLIQFAHNDANKAKAERYLTPADYREFLINKYIEPVINKGAVPVLVTAIAMREFDDEGNCRISFPEYRDMMLDIADQNKDKVKLIDLGRLTAEFNTKIGPLGCKSIYLHLPKGLFTSFPDGSEDDAHLQYNGAFAYAGLVHDELIRQKIIQI